MMLSGTKRQIRSSERPEIAVIGSGDCEREVYDSARQIAKLRQRGQLTTLRGTIFEF